MHYKTNKNFPGLSGLAGGWLSRGHCLRNDLLCVE